MEKIKDLCKKYREILLYLVFGVLTTVVGWVVYFAVLWALKGAMGLPVEDTTSGKYVAAYTAAQIIQWVAAVLFAFFTNRKWVFTDADKNVSVPIQLVKFSAGRVVTFFIDFVVTLFGAMALAKLIPAMTSVLLLGKEWNLAEIGAKVVAAVIVIVCNYIFSKIFVFKKKKIEVACEESKMKDYYNIIVDLSSKKCYMDEFVCKAKLREHNKAMTKLYKMDQELNNPEGEQVLLKLLYHDDDRVVLSAAMLCLKLKFHSKETMERLIYVKNNSTDQMISFSAEMMIKERDNI